MLYNLCKNILNVQNFLVSHFLTYCDLNQQQFPGTTVRLRVAGGHHAGRAGTGQPATASQPASTPNQRSSTHPARPLTPASQTTLYV